MATKEQTEAVERLVKALEGIDPFSLIDWEKVEAEAKRLAPEMRAMRRFLGLNR